MRLVWVSHSTVNISGCEISDPALVNEMLTLFTGATNEMNVNLQNGMYMTYNGISTEQCKKNKNRIK